MSRTLTVYRDGAYVEIDDDNPYPVTMSDAAGPAVGIGPVAGRQHWVMATVPGIGTGAAYADGDAFGTLIEFPGVFRPGWPHGLLQAIRYLDMDDEGLQVDLMLFRRPVPSGTDNGAYSPSDTDILSYLGFFQFTNFENMGANQTSLVTGLAHPICSETGTSIYGQAIARGALNIAASNLPRFEVCVLPD